jgi:hypothetical protein
LCELTEMLDMDKPKIVEEVCRPARAAERWAVSRREVIVERTAEDCEEGSRSWMAKKV